jgi:hypothetical protein
MTRREWLRKNPPPKEAGRLRLLLDDLQKINARRTDLAAERRRSQEAVDYWQNESRQPGMAGNVDRLHYANTQIAACQSRILEIDKEITETSATPGRIAQLKGELAHTAKCPTHGLDLERHRNRQEDLFVCVRGPHYLLWNLVNGKPSFVAYDTLDLPALDGEMTQ